MTSPAQLLEEAEATEYLASIVSYGPDKDKLIAIAGGLRRQAASLEDRALDPVANNKRQLM